jgi:hypothetical protein
VRGDLLWQHVSAPDSEERLWRLWRGDVGAGGGLRAERDGGAGVPGAGL